MHATPRDRLTHLPGLIINRIWQRSICASVTSVILNRLPNRTINRPRQPHMCTISTSVLPHHLPNLIINEAQQRSKCANPTAVLPSRVPSPISHHPTTPSLVSIPHYVATLITPASRSFRASALPPSPFTQLPGRASVELVFVASHAASSYASSAAMSRTLFLYGKSLVRVCGEARFLARELS